MNTSTTTDLLAEVNAEHDAAEAAELEAIRATAPTLSARAMLVMLNISVWEGRKMDKTASKQVAADNNADEKVFSTYKSLMGNCPELDAVKKLRGEVRNHLHYHYTQPWTDSGLRFLTTAAYFDYHNAMTEAQTAFTVLVDDFLDAYQSKIAEAQVSLGDRFDMTEYPTEDELRSKFRFDLSYMPLPTSGDFRVDVEDEVMTHLTESYDKFYSQQFHAAMRDIWERLQAPLANMVEKLDYVSGEDKKRFKGTLVDNVLKIVDLMGIANVTGDTQMTAIQHRLESALRSITPEALREDDSLRRHVCKEAKEALRDTQKAINELPSIW